MHVQELILRLQRYWADRGCLIGQPYDIEKGAGTMNPLTFFGALGPKPWNAGYVEPSRRPGDGRVAPAFSSSYSAASPALSLALSSKKARWP